MGLDMYLTKKTYIGAEYEHRKVTGTIDLYIDGVPVPIDLKKVSYIEETIGYWRKANAIHRWFVNNVQSGEDGCRSYYVRTEQMQELLHLVDAVLDDSEKAPDLLPTEEGFFFGSQDYDQWYFDDLRKTKEILEKAVATTDCEFYYHSSW